MPQSICKECEFIIKDILNNGKVIFASHAKERMITRGYSAQDVFYILNNGCVKDVSKEGTEKYRCKVHGNDIDGDNGVIVVELRKKVRMIIITVI